MSEIKPVDFESLRNMPTVTVEQIVCFRMAVLSTVLQLQRENAELKETNLTLGRVHRELRDELAAAKQQIAGVFPIFIGDGPWCVDKHREGFVVGYGDRERYAVLPQRYKTVSYALASVFDDCDARTAQAATDDKP